MPLRLLAIPLAFAACLHAAVPEQSPHIRAANGLEAWTLLEPIPSQGSQPMTLVIARAGHTLHRVHGDPFVWTFLFRNGGRRLAYETGPFHGSMQCVLLDTATSKQLAHYDCFHEPLAPNAPAWVKALKAAD